MIVAVTGVTLGARAGLATGARGRPRVERLPRPGPVDALADDRLGHGRRERRRWPRRCSATAAALALFGIVWGFLFDWLMDVWAWSSLGAAAAASFVALAVDRHLVRRRPRRRERACSPLVAGPTLIRMLDRYARQAARHLRTIGADMKPTAP